MTINLPKSSLIKMFNFFINVLADDFNHYENISVIRIYTGLIVLVINSTCSTTN